MMKLRVVSGPQSGAEFAVAPAGSTLGRSRVADIHLADGLLSRLHCRFYEEAGAAFVQDLGSSNGTLVNGAPAGASAVALREGDVVTVGETALRVSLGGAEAAPAEPPKPEEPPPPEAAPEGTAKVVDLGLSPDAPADGPRRRGGVAGLIAALAAAAALAVGGGLFFAWGREGEAEPAARRLPAAEEQPFAFRYERLAIDANKLFRYTLTFDDGGTLALAIDDLGDADRSFVKEKALSPRARDALRKVLVDAHYGEIGEMFPERSADGVSLRRRSLTIVFGPEVWSRVAENTSQRDFDGLCERLETFGRNELGAWATQYSVAELREMGEAQLQLARRYWEQRDLGDEKLFLCVTAYRKGLSALETLNPKPAFAAALAEGLREAEGLLAERHEAEAFAVDQAMNTQRYDDAAEALRKILRMIPDRDDPRNIEATERLLSVENRYLKGGR